MNHKQQTYILSALMLVLLMSTAASNILIYSFCAIVFYVGYINKSGLNLNIIDKAFIFFFLIGLLSTLWTSNLEFGIEMIKKRLGFVLFPIVFAMLRSQQKGLDLQLIKKFFVLGVLIFSAIIIFSSTIDIYINNKPIHYFLQKNVRFELINISPISFHPPYISLYVNIALLIVYDYYKSRSQYFVPIVLTVYFGLIIYLMSSLAGIATFVSTVTISVLLFFIRLKRLKKSINVILTAIFLIGISVYSIVEQNSYNPSKGYWQTPTYRISRFIYEGDPSRVNNWNSAINLIKESPLFGYGIGDFTDKLQLTRDKDSRAFNERYNSHNQYISVIGESGIIALLLLIYIFILLIIESFKQRNAYFFLIIATFMVSFFVENYLERQQGYFLFLITTLLFYNNSFYEAQKNIKPDY